MFSLNYQIKILIAKELGIDVLAVVLDQYEIPLDKKRIIERKISKLKKGIPLDYLLGEIKILGLEIAITNHTLIPREETEDWVAKFKNLITESKNYKTDTLVDLGTGSGLIGLSLAGIYDKVWLVDISIKALKVARRNATVNGIKNVQLLKCDGLDSKLMAKLNKSKTLDWHLVANLPYLPESDSKHKIENKIEFEPSIALYSGNDGLDLFRKVVFQIDQMVNKPKIAIWELDPRNIKDAKEFLDQIGYVSNIWKDKNGQERVLASVLEE